MTDLTLKGPLDLNGTLNFIADGGKVKIGGNDVLVKTSPEADPQCSNAPSVPPPIGAADPGTEVWIILSFNQSVKVNENAAVAQGIAMQGTKPNPIWPGMVLPSDNNNEVKISGTPINVKGDRAIIFASGGIAEFDESGQ